MENVITLYLVGKALGKGRTPKTYESVSNNKIEAVLYAAELGPKYRVFEKRVEQSRFALS